MDGDISALIDRFLKEAGEHKAIFDWIYQMQFDSREIIEQCGETAKGHGFWDVHRKKALKVLNKKAEEGQWDIADQTHVLSALVDYLCEAHLLGDPTIFLALIMTECAEAIEAYRNGNRVGKDGMWEELADVVIRLFDFVARYGPDDQVDGETFMALVAAKMAKNESRPRLHGKSF